MRFALQTLGLLLISLLMPFAGRAATFTAALDRDRIVLGESTTLSLTFEGGQPERLSPLNVPGLAFDNPSKNFRQNIDIISGQVVSILVFGYTVTPQQVGEFTIPAMTVTIGGQKVASRPLKLTVTRPTAADADAIKSGNEPAFMTLELPRKRLFIGEKLSALLKIYCREGIQIGNFRLTGNPASGFQIGKMAQGENSRVQIGGHNFVVTPVHIELTVEKSGALSLGPFTAGAILLVPRGDMPQMPMFRGMFDEQRQIALATRIAEADGRPMPTQNQPADFKGLMADLNVTINVGPTNLTVGDPVTVRIQVSGRGPLDDIKLPEPVAVKDFKIFQSSATITNLDPLGVQGTKIFELVAAPQTADTRDWPSLNLTCNGSSSYFNPADGAYHTLSAEAVPLAIQAAGATPLPQMAAAKQAAEEKTPQDILPIKDKPSQMTQGRTILISQPVFLGLQTVPVLAFLAAFVWRKRADNLANNPRLRRQRAVAALIAGGKSDLKKFAAGNQPDEFFATLFRLLQEQLGERLDCPAASITENVVEENSILRAAPENLRNALREQFQLCNQARYAPVRGTAELNSVAAQFEKLLAELQNLKS